MRYTKLASIAVIVLVVLSNEVIMTNAMKPYSSQGLVVKGTPISEWLKGFPKIYGGTLKAALPGEPNVFNWWTASSLWDLIVLSPIYSRLVRIINGTLAFELAESIEWSPDYKVLTIRIVKGVKFHDGKPLTAHDVAFTIDILSKKSWTYYHGYFINVEKVEVVDDYTLKIYFKAPDAGFIYNALTVMNIMPKHIWEPIFKSIGDGVAKYSPKIPDDLVGSGPFKIVEYVPGQYVKYVANKDYWLGRPCIDELIYVFISEANVAILAVQKGEVDAYVGWVTPEVVPELLSTPGVSVHVFVSDTFYHWGLNNLKWPFNITEFRRALAYCVDREAIVKELLMGYGTIGNPGVVPPFGVHAQWCNKELLNKYKFNLTKAAEILDKLGFKDIDGDGWREAPNGEEFSFEIYAPSYDVIRVRVAELISEWLSKIPGGGLKAIPKAVEWKTVWPLIKGAKVDTWLLGSGTGNDISWLLRRFHSRPEGTGNWVRYFNPIVDELTEKLVTAFDPEERKRIAYRIQEIIAEDVPLITLYYRKFPMPYRIDKFDGWFLAEDEPPVNFITLLRVHLKQYATAPTTQPTVMAIRKAITTIIVIAAIIAIIAILLIRKRTWYK